MSKPPSPCKAQCLEEMQAQLIATGAIDTPSFYAKYPEVSKATIWQWASRVRKQEPMPADVKAAYRKIEERIEEGAPGMDAMPYISPSVVARGGEEALRQIDYAHELRILWSDSRKLREFSVRAQPGVEKPDLLDPEHFRIQNPVQFEKSIKVRVGLIEAGLGMLQKVWDMRTVQLFYEAIVTEIGKESPEVQARILERLDVLNRRHGMAMSLRI